MADTETIYTKKIDGKTYERAAHTPADHVECEFNGWVKKADAKPATASSASAGDAKSTTK